MGLAESVLHDLEGPVGRSFQTLVVGRAVSAAGIDPGLRIGSVRLAVADLDRSVDFYERVSACR